MGEGGEKDKMRKTASRKEKGERGVISIGEVKERARNASMWKRKLLEGEERRLWEIDLGVRGWERGREKKKEGSVGDGE